MFSSTLVQMWFKLRLADFNPFFFFCTANVGYCGGGSGKLFKVGILPEGKDNLRIVMRRIQNETILTDKRVLGSPKRARRTDERGIRRFAGEVRSPAPSISLLSPPLVYRSSMTATLAFSRSLFYL